MRAEDLMSSPAVTVRPTTPTQAAAALMASHGFSTLPVVDGHGHLLGVITENDMLRSRYDRGDHLIAPATVGEAMTAPVWSADRDTAVADLAAVLVGDGTRCVPVTCGDVVVGVVTRRDLLRALVRDDLMIAAEVRSRLRDYSGDRRWQITSHGGTVTVAVDDALADGDDRAVVIRRLARSVPGVRAVEITRPLREPSARGSGDR
ncbi:CBS domain-containing protein [Allokutzneria oryzae]|uniref:HPP family protein n=1 Tax=Allokutzneria oryzae TaxID=1378989 RepID=A0ABV6A3F4_9PSEU